MRKHIFLHASMHACMRACMRACVRACVRVHYSNSVYIIQITFQNAMGKAMIPAWKHVARISFGPERHLTTNVAASEFTTTGSTSAVTANSSRKENENSADRFCWCEFNLENE